MVLQRVGVQGDDRSPMKSCGKECILGAKPWWGGMLLRCQLQPHQPWLLVPGVGFPGSPLHCSPDFI